MPRPRPRPGRPAGSTWPRCRAGCRPPARSSTGAPWTTDSSKSVSNSTPGAVAPGALDRVRGDQVEPNVLPARPPPRASPRAPARSARRSARSSRRSARRRRGAAARAPRRTARSPRARTSMFVRRLVSGVRSSWEASATSCRCALLESSSAAEHRVEARGEPAELVVRPRSTRSAARGRRVSVTRLGRVGQPPDRRERRARRRAGRALRRPPMPPAAIEDQEERDPVERRGRPRSSGRATWSA